MAELNYQFRQRLSQVHLPDRRMDFAVRGEDDVEIDSSWSVVIPGIKDRVLYNAARDLEDYFAVSMGVFVGFGKPSEKLIRYETDPSLGENSYEISVTDSLILLRGSDSRYAAKAGYYIEDLMNLAEAPYLKKQDTVRRCLYRPRMTHSGYGLDEFPDSYLNQMAHGGFTSVVVFARGVDLTPHGYQDFNDLIYRAAGYGLDVYAYSYMRSRLYPEGEEAKKFYDSLYGELFRRCPGLKGIVFVGESVEFPSRDPHTSGMLHTDNIGPDGHRIIKKPNPGWWPCEDFPLWIDMVKSVIRKEKPDADIVFWTYNWGYVEEKYRIALIDSLPTDISLQVTFEMFEPLDRNGFPGKCVDYTICFEGPGRYFTSEAIAAKRRGIRLYSMTNTGGLCWDMGVAPYIPAPYQWIKRFQAMKRAHDDWGLCGIMDSHHYGWYPSFISDLARWMFEAPDSDPEELLRKLAVRDFSCEGADDVLEAYRLFSEAAYEQISVNRDQYGPIRVGPSFPLVFIKNDFVFRSESYSMHGKNAITIPSYIDPAKEPQAKEKLRGELVLYTSAAAKYSRGAKILDGVLGTVDPKKLDNARRIANLAHFFAASVTTAVNVKKWHLKKMELFEAQNAAEKKALIAEMRAIGEDEIENARSAIPLVEFDSRLGFEPSMDYMTDAAHIREKIEYTRKVLDTELEDYLKQ